ncbi:MAG: hypothetical protein M1823_001827 [Watsoniomyces obsoletus]|nr:MAG: hypothetical protein M1823_001827 [Watsoniomyces obsoletus]
MLQEIYSQASGSTLLAVAVALLGGIVVSSWIQEERKIKSLGARAPVVRVYLPFGLDAVYWLLKSASNYTDMMGWRTWFESKNSHTIEVNLGGERHIVTDEPEIIKTILTTQFSDFGKGQQFHHDWHDFLGDSIFTTDGDAWHKSRQLIRAQFVKDRVSDLQTFEHHSKILLSMMAGEKDGASVDVKELFFRYSLDAATDFLLGSSVNSLENSTTGFAHSFAEVQRIQAIYSRAGEVGRLFPRGTFRKHLRVLNEFIEPFIENTLRLSPEELEKKTKSDSGYTFLHALAGFTRDRKMLRDQLCAVLLAGRDTTACTLSWTFYELARHPSVVMRLRQEIADTLGFDRPPTYDDLKSMKYLRWVIDETLRLYPVVPFNVRSALRDTTLPRGGGPDGSQPIGTPKDTPIAYSVLSMQRRPDLYPPPSETFAPVLDFSPERWEHWTPKSWQYIPFNGGPRICIGQQFALTELSYTIVRVLQTFERVEPRSEVVRDGTMPMKSEIVLSPAKEVMVAFYRPEEKVKS